MKSLILMFLAAATLAAAPIANLAPLLNQPPAAAVQALGPPAIKYASGADWDKAGWDVGLRYAAEKIVQATINVPKGKSPADLTAAAAAFGFTPAAGWVVGTPYKSGIQECVTLTHSKLGIITLKTTPGDAPDRFSLLRFLTPGRQ